MNGGISVKPGIPLLCLWLLILRKGLSRPFLYLLGAWIEFRRRVCRRDCSDGPNATEEENKKMEQNVQVEFGGRTITLSTGKMAKQASGAVVVSCGDTVVLVTVVAKKKQRKGRTFSRSPSITPRRHMPAARFREVFSSAKRVLPTRKRLPAVLSTVLSARFFRRRS